MELKDCLSYANGYIVGKISELENELKDTKEFKDVTQREIDSVNVRLTYWRGKGKEISKLYVKYQ